MLCEKCQNLNSRPLHDCELIRQEPDKLLDCDVDNDNIVVYFHHKARLTRKLQRIVDDISALCCGSGAQIGPRSS